MPDFELFMEKGSEKGIDEIKFLVHPIYFGEISTLQIFS